MADEKYQRLTRERTPRKFITVIAVTRYSLWLGSDHILLVQCTGYTESYKRFYFSDIQAITIQATRARQIINWIFGTLAFIFLVFCVPNMAGGHPGAGTFVLLFLTVFVCGIPLLFNNLFGTTCACQVRTAVQTEDLPSLRRVRQTRKVLAKVLPLIIAAQGQLTAEEVSLKMREAAQTGLPYQQSP
jgi:hypothetical protein